MPCNQPESEDNSFLIEATLEEEWEYINQLHPHLLE